MAIRPMTAINCTFCPASISNRSSSLHLLARDLRPLSHPVSRITSLSMADVTTLIMTEVHIRDMFFCA